MESVLSSILMSYAGTQIPNLESSLAAVKQTPHGVVANLSDISDSSSTANYIEPGEIPYIYESDNNQENISQQSNKHQVNSSQLHMFDDTPKVLNVQSGSISVV